MSSSIDAERSALRPSVLRRVLAPVGEVVSIDHFEGGTFARVARVTLGDGREVAVKGGVDAGASDALLSHEADVIRTERDVLRLACSHPSLRLPRLLLVDFTREFVDVDVIVTEVTPGRLWSACSADMPAAAYETTDRERGAVLAAFAQVAGGRFGFVSDRAPAYSGNDWHSSFRKMVQGLADDAVRFGIDARASDLLHAVDRHSAALRRVPVPRLVHGDLWPGNVLVEHDTGRITGVIDPERALWGDPLYDIAGALQGTVSGIPPALRSGYVANGGTLDPDADARHRLDLYLLWFATCMLVETRSRRLAAAEAAERVRWLAPQIAHLHGRLG